MKRLGGDANKINPLVPVDLVIDHSVQVDYFGSADALTKNVDIEFGRNAERYSFLRWASRHLKTFVLFRPPLALCIRSILNFLPVVFS